MRLARPPRPSGCRPLTLIWRACGPERGDRALRRSGRRGCRACPSAPRAASPRRSRSRRIRRSPSIARCRPVRDPPVGRVAGLVALEHHHRLVTAEASSTPSRSRAARRLTARSRVSSDIGLGTLVDQPRAEDHVEAVEARASDRRRRPSGGTRTRSGRRSSLRSGQVQMSTPTTESAPRLTASAQCTPSQHPTSRKLLPASSTGRRNCSQRLGLPAACRSPSRPSISVCDSSLLIGSGRVDLCGVWSGRDQRPQVGDRPRPVAAGAELTDPGLQPRELLGFAESLDRRRQRADLGVPRRDARPRRPVRARRARGCRWSRRSPSPTSAACRW